MVCYHFPPMGTTGALRPARLVRYLPADIAVGNITAIQVTVNYKGLTKTQQRWAWSLYDWTTAKWIYVGDNTTARRGLCLE